MFIDGNAHVSKVGGRGDERQQEREENEDALMQPSEGCKFKASLKYTGSSRQPELHSKTLSKI